MPILCVKKKIGFIPLNFLAILPGAAYLLDLPWSDIRSDIFRHRAPSARIPSGWWDDREYSHSFARELR